MTEQELRALDGDALCAEAYLLGLAPVRTWLLDEGRGWATEEDARQLAWIHWEPHVNLAQAQKVFQALRSRGWSQQTAYNTSIRHGVVSAHDAPWGVYKDATHAAQVHFGPGYPHGEAHALLLCAVLAVSAQEGDDA